MAFARMGDDSDVYVYLSVTGKYVCCGCKLNMNTTGMGFETNTARQMVAHVWEHVNAKHLVPVYVIPALLKRCKETL